MAINTFDVQLQWTKMITPSVMHLAFTRPDGETLAYIPGQFITFMFENDEGKLVRRSYSLANIPGQTDELEIAVSPVEGGFATDKFFNAQPGDVMPCSGPFGRLVLKDEDVSHIILVATGTGVSPYRSMLPSIAERLQQNSQLKFTVLLGVQYAADLLYADDFIAFAEQHDRFEFRAYLSREENLIAPHQFKGYVQSAYEGLNLDPDTDVFYLCGNPNMIDDSFAMLQDMGFGSRSVRREKYISAK
tara:strand:- start:26351 stop:27088 length:738 start_codon:yes stop_codon:yes gene_type:complete